MTPSTYQSAIYDHVGNNNKSLLVEAVAGSGKTTTIVGAAEQVPYAQRKESLFVAFSKPIATELGHRLPSGFNCSTIHSAGLRYIRASMRSRFNVQDGKYYFFSEELLKGKGFTEEQRLKEKTKFLKKATEMAQLTLVDLSDEVAWDDLLTLYDVNPYEQGFSPEELAGLVEEILERGRNDLSLISFTDMVWVPVVNNLVRPDYDMLMVDEAQDLSNCLRKFTLGMLRKGGKAVFVGDSRQAIMGFAYANTDSMNLIHQETLADTLPLSVCYRCPSSHINLAKEIVPQIEAGPNAINGVIEDNRYDQMLETISSNQNDMLIGRTTAPLVEAAMDLLRRGTPVNMKGKDLLGPTITLAKTVNKRDKQEWVTFPQTVDDYFSAQVEVLNRRKNAEWKVANLQDKVDTLHILVEKANEDGVNSFPGFLNYVDETFNQETKGAVNISTIHRAKGLESNRVFVFTDKLPHPKAEEGWQKEQEMNLKYVALTRSKEYLGLCAAKPQS
jgi:DNA helicase-2/ATP-dependent DNA helicase PcrA